MEFCRAGPSCPVDTRVKVAIHGGYLYILVESLPSFFFPTEDPTTLGIGVNIDADNNAQTGCFPGLAGYELNLSVALRTSTQKPIAALSDGIPFTTDGDGCSGLVRGNYPGQPVWAHRGQHTEVSIPISIVKSRAPGSNTVKLFFAGLNQYGSRVLTLP